MFQVNDNFQRNNRSHLSTLSDDQGVHIKKYYQLAMGLGMHKVALIGQEDLVFDERVRLKCQIPLCKNFGVCGSCPPNLPSVDQLKSAFSKYSIGLLLIREYDTSKVLSAEFTGTQKEMFEAVGRIELEAHRDGYELALGLANGSCKKLFCGDRDCEVIRGNGKCRAPLKARPSMEACGIWVYEMMRNLGLEIYPVGNSEDQKTMPYMLAVGLVMIA